MSIAMSNALAVIGVLLAFCGISAFAIQAALLLDAPNRLRFRTKWLEGAPESADQLTAGLTAPAESLRSISSKTAQSETIGFIPD